MRNPNPINLQTSAEARAGGWHAESRDADGHLISCHAPIERRDRGIVDWILECTRNGETVTFWPTDPAVPLPPADVPGAKPVRWQRRSSGTLNMSADGWVDVSQEEVSIYRARGQETRVLYELSPARDALGAIRAERERQIAKGYDAVHDDAHRHGSILWAKWGAIARLNDAKNTSAGDTEAYKKLLTQAAAQIVAEIERVDRAAP